MLHDWLVALADAPWVYLTLFAITTIDGFFPPVPSEPAVIALAALSVSAGTMPNLALILLAAAAGAFTGDQIAYAVGSRIEVRRLRILRSPRGQRTVDCAERALAQRGPSFILAARFVPIGRVAVNLTAGAVRFPRRTFVGLTALAAVTWSLYSVAIGLLAGAWIQDRPVVAITAGVVGGVLGGLVLDWVLHRRQTHKDRRQTLKDRGLESNSRNGSARRALSVDLARRFVGGGDHTGHVPDSVTVDRGVVHDGGQGAVPVAQDQRVLNAQAGTPSRSRAESTPWADPCRPRRWREPA